MIRIILQVMVFSLYLFASVSCGTNKLSDSGNPGERVIATGDTVWVHYVGTLESGEEFDNSRERSPFSFTLGQGQVIEGFETGVLGLSTGQTVKITLEPEKAYGPYNSDLVFQYPITGAPEGISIGDEVVLDNGSRARIISITDEIVEIDANHPLAGKVLIFEIEVMAIE
ncbi:MAG: peptidylprolyl isomerase [Dehalococcoidia bacterium]|tara:strand:+ start:634 stop:1143 length:510 start_codon:yes stop_codon:yes gene_type:complete